MAFGTTEHVEVTRLVARCCEELASLGVQAECIPVHLLLHEKIAWINRKAVPEDVLVSVHMNSGKSSARGLEVYYYGGSSESLHAGARLQKALSLETMLSNRGLKPDTQTRHGRLGIIRDTKPWAFLLEFGFLTSQEDLEYVRTKGGGDLARALFAWLSSW